MRKDKKRTRRYDVYPCSVCWSDGTMVPNINVLFSRGGWHCGKQLRADDKYWMGEKWSVPSMIVHTAVCTQCHTKAVVRRVETVSERVA